MISKLKKIYGGFTAILFSVLVWMYIKKFKRAKELEPFFPTPKFMRNLLTGYLNGWLRGVRSTYGQHYHFRINMFEEVSKENGRKEDTIQLTTPLFLENPALLTRDPVFVKHILKDNFDSFVKPIFVKLLLTDFLGEGIFVVNHGSTSKQNDTWNFQRKTAAKIFTKNLFTGHVYTTLIKNCDKIINILNENDKKVVEMKRLIYGFTLDSIGDIGFGVDLDSLSSENPLKFSTAFDEIVQNTSMRPLQPQWLVFGRLLKSERDLFRNLKVLDEFAEDIINQRKNDADLQSKGDILSLFMQSEKGKDLSNKFLRDVIMSFMIAGRDTTACTLSFTIYLLATHMEIQDRLLEEIKNVFNNRSKEARATLEMLNEMPFLSGVVLEALRLFPPVPVDLKCAARDSVFPNGATVYKGTIVSYEPFVMGRDETRFKDAGKFIPERWLSDDGKMPSYDQYEMPVFQAGQRFCLGKDLAAYEIKVLLIELLRRFKFSWPKKFSMDQSDVSFLNGACVYQPGVTLSFKDSLNILVERR